MQLVNVALSIYLYLFLYISCYPCLSVSISVSIGAVLEQLKSRVRFLVATLGIMYCESNKSLITKQ